jgi:hypothetical protein
VKKTQLSLKYKGFSAIINAIDNISVGGIVVYATPHPYRDLRLNEENSERVRKVAQKAERSGQVMLFSKRHEGVIYSYALGVRPKDKRAIERAVALVDLPQKV